MNDMKSKITALLKENGVYDIGFSRLTDSPCSESGLNYAVSIVAALSDAVVDEIGNKPTHTYFHHYRTVNAYIDSMLLRTGLLLQSEGFRYVPVAASQTIRTDGERTHMGLYSHKKAAVLAGLGTIGKSTLFLHRELGPRVRLGTLLTDCPLAEENTMTPSSCGNCRLCAEACPAGAIKGAEWQPGTERDELLDAAACNTYMREHFMKIGRGAVCGICMRVCPKRKKCGETGRYRR